MHYKFLSDKPEGIDNFQSQAHTKIATAITEVIKKEEIKLIGIEGKWGSGKSNIIKLIENKLENKDYIFYIYDTWGYQEDLQRKSFLENLVDVMENNLNESKLKESESNESELKESLKKLLAKKIETEEKEIPILNKKLLLLLFLSNIILKIPIFQRLNLFFLSTIIITITIIYHIRWRAIDHIVVKMRKFISLDELFYLYQNKVQAKKIETIISTNEPSVREFKKWLEDISKRLIKENKKLVIVYDNIDRLQSQKVKEIWGTIHTFFAGDGYKNITVLIPFSKEQLEKTFDETEGVIEKTFSVTYNVTPPVLIDWKSYFDEKFSQIFPDHQDEERNIIRILYHKENEELTPRSINIFINQIKVMYSVYSEIELKYIALFILIKKDIENNILSYFYREDFQNYKRILGEDLDKKIAALYFGVEEKYAIEVLLKEDLIKALKKGDYSKVDEMSKLNGFDQLLGIVITELGENLELNENYRNILLALKNQKLDIFNPIFNPIFNSFIDGEKYFTFTEYHRSLLEKVENDKKEEEVIRKLLGLNLYEDKDKDKINKYSKITEEEKGRMANICKQFNEFIEYIKEKGYDFKKYIVEKREYRVELVFVFLKEFKDKYEDYGVDFEEEDLSKYLYSNFFFNNEEEKEALNILNQKYEFFKLKRVLLNELDVIPLMFQNDYNIVFQNIYSLLRLLFIKAQEKLNEKEGNFDIPLTYIELMKSKLDKDEYMKSIRLALASIEKENKQLLDNINIYTFGKKIDYRINCIAFNEKIYRIVDRALKFVSADRLLVLLYSLYNSLYSLDDSSTIEVIHNYVEAIVMNKNIRYINVEYLIEYYPQIENITPLSLRKKLLKMIEDFSDDDFKIKYRDVLKKYKDVFEEEESL